MRVASVSLTVYWQRHRNLVLSGAASFLTGMTLVMTAGHWMGVDRSPIAPIVRASRPSVVSDAAKLLPMPPETAVPPAVVLAAVRPPPERAAGLPPWRRFAVAVPPIDGRPMIAVIIDDVGLDRARSRLAMALPGPVTISLMSYAPDAQRQADDARAHGHELMMHVPMQPIGRSMDPGPDALDGTLKPEELHRRIDANLERFSGYVGINNHMGSQFTQDRPGMDEVMTALRQRGLLFIDSMTIGNSVGLQAARTAGVPTAARDVFIDNDSTAPSVDNYLAQVETVARRKGSVIAIGHPHDGTLAALNAWLPTLAAKGFVLVPVTAVVVARQVKADRE